jgi:hypothetical protein
MFGTEEFNQSVVQSADFFDGKAFHIDLCLARTLTSIANRTSIGLGKSFSDTQGCVVEDYAPP